MKKVLKPLAEADPKLRIESERVEPEAAAALPPLEAP